MAMATNPKPQQAPWGEYVPRVGRMTVEQFEAFPGEDGWMYELHEGRLISMPGPGNEHSDIQANFFRTLDNYLLRNNLGKLSGTGCYNLPLQGNREELLCPDLSYVLPIRKAAMKKRGSYLVGAPDLVVEIASPGDSRPELAAKTAIYLLAGVRLVWIVWPKSRTIDVWRPTSPERPIATLAVGDELDGLEVIPGFRCSIGDLFAM